MINLIKNELFKLRHRKEIWILLIIVILMAIVVNIMNYVFSNVNEKIYHKEIESMIKMDKDMKKYADTIEDKAYYMSDYDMNTLKLKYPMYSAETGYINNVLTDLSAKMYQTKLLSGEESESYLTIKEEYQKALEKLNNNYDWKQDIKEKINENTETINVLKNSLTITESTKKQIEYFEEIVRVLNYRIENNIPEDGTLVSLELENYLENLSAYQNVNLDTINREEKAYYMDLEKNINIMKYKLDHNLIQEDKNNNSYQTLSGEMEEIAKGKGFMLLFFAIFVAAMIIPMEFEKGTIRQLLVKPYTRAEILTSKILSAIIFFIGFTCIYMLINVVILGFFVGFSTINAPIIVYNFNTQEASQVVLVLHLLKCFILVLPKFLTTIFIVMLISILSKNLILSMYLGLGINLVELSMLQKPISRFIISNCWDFNTFANGAISMNQYVDLSSSIVVVAVTMILSLIGSYISFQRKEIKNQ